MPAFFDTNIIIYSFVQNDPDKSHVARRVLEQWSVGELAIVSTQVLNETFSNAIRKYKVSREDARNVVNIIAAMPVVETTRQMVLDAADLSVESQLTIWDSLMIVAAASAGCDRIYTEDLNHGQIVRGVRIVNPFREDTEST